ncbi:hypothetical protein WA158_004834 [Blastocystis sp. Blastoise]
MDSTKVLLLVFLTLVTTVQTIKSIVAYLILVFQIGSQKTNHLVYERVFVQWRDTLLLFVPSILYSLQNTFLIVAISNLDAAVYSVTYQMKIVVTAFLSICMLNKHLNTFQWLGILLLIPGVALVQYDSSNHVEDLSNKSPLLGFICIVFCSLSSGFAGVFFEKLLKGKNGNLWVQSIQLCAGSAAVAIGLAIAKDGHVIYEKGFFYGYNRYAWASVLLNALSGIVIATVVKYTDNIVKGLSSSISMVLSCIVSILLFGFIPTSKFYIGTFLVFFAVILYTVFPSLFNIKTKEKKNIV